MRLEPLEDRRLLAITVNTLFDELDGSIVDGDISLRDAVSLAPAGETIDFDPLLTSEAPATILLTLGEIVINKSLTINGPGSFLLTLDASGSDPFPDDNFGDGSRLFNVSDGTNTLQVVTLSGLALTGADYSGDGGAIFSEEELHLSDMRIYENAASYRGGGIANSGGALTITGSTISGNVGGVFGGGINSRFGALSIEASYLFANRAGQEGGGIDVYVSSATSIVNSTVTGNTAGFSGGGMNIRNGTVQVTGSSLRYNQSYGNGGGIFNRYGDLTVTDSTISGNTATNYGGGIRSNSGNLTLTNSSVSNNTAKYGNGGGVDNNYGTMTVNSSVVSGNRARNAGGGIRSGGYGRTLIVTDSTISSNVSTNGIGGGIFVSFGHNLRLERSAISNNTSDGAGGGVRAAYADVTVIDSVISGNSSMHGPGGGISSDSGGRTTSITRSTIQYNSAPGGFAGGGGIYQRFGTVLITETAIRGNSSILDGGGIHHLYGPTVITDSTIASNSTQSSGGGISQRGDLTVTNSTFEGNHATSKGGAIRFRDGLLKLTNSTISGNVAGDNGGGLYVVGSPFGSARIEHSTIADNVAGTFGGGLVAIGAALELSHTIVARNNATFSRDMTSLFGTIQAQYCLIGHNEGSGLASTPSGAPDANGNRIGPVMSTEPLRVIIDMAAMGDFEGGPAGDSFLFEYSIDGGPFQPLLTSSVDESANQGYFMDRGTFVSLDDPLVMNGTYLNKFFQVVFADIPVSGAEIRIRFTATNDGPSEAFAWRNLFIQGVNTGNFVGSAVTFDESGDVFASFISDVDYTIPGDMFGIRSRLNPGTPSLPFDIADDSISIFPSDVQGIISEFDPSRFFGVVDTVNGVGGNTDSATWTFNNVLVPLDPLLAPIADNGGRLLSDGRRIRTHALLPGSPALDTGDAAAVAGVGGVPEFDGRGYHPFTRVADGDNSGGPRIDIGAVEEQSLHLVVDTLADEQDGDHLPGDFSLREAVELSNSNSAADTIEFDTDLAGGTIVLGLGELFVSDVVKITGLGDELLAIDARGNDPTPYYDNGDGSRVFTIASSQQVSTEITGLTLRGGDTFSGGAIRNTGNLLIADSTISGNSAIHRGGGIESYGQLTLINSLMTGNRATGYSGGGIWANNMLTMTNSIVTGNTSGIGGGMSMIYGTLSIVDSVVSGNTASNNGGGIYVRGATASITGSAIQGNVSQSKGGGIYARYSGIHVSGSTISQNNAAISGGGMAITISNVYTSSAVVNSTISGNAAGVSGGGVYWFGNGGAELSLTLCTIVQNFARFGGGVFGAAGTVALENSILAQNNALIGRDITGVIGATFAPHFSLIGSNANSGLTEAPVVSPDINGNLIGGPIGGAIDPQIGSLTGNGPLLPDGSRLATHPLLAASPARDAGDPAAVAGVDGVPEFDERGTPFVRVADGNGDSIPRIDMGAVEAQTLTLVVDTLADELDSDLGPGDLSLREALTLANSNLAASDQIMFDPALAGGTILLSMGSLIITDEVLVNGLGDDLLTVDASGNDPTPDEDNFDGSTVLEISSSGGTVEIHGLTLTGGDTFSGGAIRANGGAVRLVDSTISGNFSSRGGGIYGAYSNLTITRSTISGNAARYSGGGIGSRFGNVTLTDSTISGNTSEFGSGGGLYSFVFGGVSITSSTISENTSGFRGGGLFVSTTGPSTITGSTISSNSAAYQGGGIFNSYGTMNIRHSTITGNRATNNGGGIFAAGTEVLNHTIAAGNFRGNNVRNDVTGTVTIGFTLLGVNTSATVTSQGGNLIGSAGSPINPVLGPLAMNGGPTMTHALLVGSPALNAGSVSAVPGTGTVPHFDQRGAPYTRVSGGRIDIGSMERQPTPAVLFGDYDNSGVVDTADYVVWRKTWTNAVPAYTGADGDGDGVVDDDDYAIWRAHFGDTVPVVAAGAEAIGEVQEFAAASVRSSDDVVASVESGVAESLPLAVDVAPEYEPQTFAASTVVEVAPSGSIAADVLATFHRRADQQVSGPRHDAGVVRGLGAARQDEALVAWMAGRVADFDSKEDRDVRTLADADLAEDSAESYCEAVDAVFERLLVAL